MYKKLRACALAAFFALGAVAVGAKAETAGKNTAKAKLAAEERVTDVILARRNLMAAIGRNMDGITGMLEPGGKMDPADASEHADEIAVMLLAFGHLFPPGTNRWSAELEKRDPARVSEAAPAVWRESVAFREMAKSASQQATATSRSADETQFRIRAAALETSCLACHAQFRRKEKPYYLPIAPLK